MNVYVNNEDVRLGEGLETSVAPDATVIVLPAMAGGCEMIDLASPCGLSGFLSQPPDSSRNDDRSHLQACGDAGSII